MAAIFREQGRRMGRAIDRLPLDPQDRHTGAIVDTAWAGVASGMEEPFTIGATFAMLAGETWGWRRAQEDIAATTEAIATYVPPAPGGWTVDPKTGYPDLTGTPFGLANPRAIEAARAHGATMVRNVDDGTRDRLRHLVTDARANGQSGDKLAARIRGEFPHMAAARPQAHIRDRAHLIAVTETSMAYERGKRLAAASSQAAGLAMVKSWLTVGDTHVDELCAGNEAADELPMDDAFPSGHEAPPAHPGCRCTSQYRALTSAERGIDLTGPSEAPSRDAAIATAEAAIHGLPTEELHVFARDGSLILRKQGDKSSVPIGDTEMTTLRNGVLTHNHPAGSSFSPDDIRTAIDGDLDEIRAIGTNPLGERWLFRMLRSGGRKGEWPTWFRSGQKLGIRAAFQVHEEAVTAEFRVTIAAAADATALKEAIAQANATHHHEVWTRVARQLGIDYRREAW